MIRITGDDIFSRTGGHGRRTFHRCAKRTHDTATVWLLLHGDFHLINRAFQAKGLRCITERRAPLAGTGLRRDIGRSFLLAIIALRDGGIDLMRTQRVDTLILEVNMRGRAQCLFQSVSANKRGGTIVFIALQDFRRYIYPRVLLIQLLFRTLGSKNMRQIISR